MNIRPKEEKRHGEGTVARQFMDLGQSEKAEKDEISESSSAEGRSPAGNNTIVESMERRQINNSSSSNNETAVVVEDTRPDQGRPNHAGWLSNKVPKFNTSSKDVDQQAQETIGMIRKARVSVRARSEASMVINFNY